LKGGLSNDLQRVVRTVAAAPACCPQPHPKHRQIGAV